MDMIEILKTAVQKGASDIHMVIGQPPTIRLRGAVSQLEEFPALTAEESKKLIDELSVANQSPVQSS